jgi:hypothetical protein
MRRKYLRFLSIVTLAAISNQNTIAMDDDILTVRKSKAQGTIIQGNVDPSNVPFFIRYEVFFSLYGSYRDAVIQQISPEDDEILSSAAASKMDWEIAEQPKRDAAWLDLCSNRDGKATSEIAREVDALDQAGYSRREHHWRDVLNNLSPSGREAVESFVDSEVATGISTEIPSVAELERLELSTFTSFVDSECYKVLTGDYPEDMKQSMEKFDRLVEQKGLDAIGVKEDQ